MYYLIGRDLDADGNYEFVKDMENMILTEDANSAIQMTETQLGYLDMEYLNEAGFYALEADRFQVSILEKLLFSPIIMGYRPRVAPPPRRPRRMPPPPPRRPRRPAPPRRHTLSAMGVLGALLDPGPAPRKHAPKPRRIGPKARAAGLAPARGPRGGRPAAPARGGAGRAKAPARPGERGGRGPGR